MTSHQNEAWNATNRDRVWANSRDLMVVLDGDGIFRAVNPAWTRVLGHSDEEVVGHSYLDFVHPDDAALTPSGFAAPHDLMNFDSRHLSKEGKTIWISWYASVAGGFVYAYGRDISSQKASADELALAQSRVRAIFETTFLYQGLLTPQGILLDANTTALRSIGKSLDDVQGKPFAETPWFTGTPGMPESVKLGIQAAASGTVVRKEIYVNLPVGGWRWFDFALRPVRDGGGTVVAIVPEALELTDRKLAEAALRQSQKLDAMGQLTGGVAHDFNNLLLPIVGSLDMLHRRGLGSDREQRLIVNALKSAERAKVLVQRLLAFARQQPLQPAAVEVGTLIEEISGLITSTTGPQIELIVQIEKSLPAASADPNQLEMAILNLSVNARDAMPAGGTLRISASCHVIDGPHRTSLKPGRYICLSVSDTGHGMDSATLTRSIEPFFSTKGIGKGTGLGLSMVHGLASQLGGALFISSKAGVGTNAELWLPVSEEVAAVERAISTEPGSSAISGTALLVDDEEMIRVCTADMLAELGLAVIEVASANEALAIVRRGDAIDIVITDHLMPGMTGLDLARAVTAERPLVPVLIVSGFAEVEALPPHLPRLSKPFCQADLAKALQELLAGRTNTLH